MKTRFEVQVGRQWTVVSRLWTIIRGNANSWNYWKIADNHLNKNYLANLEVSPIRTSIKQVN